MNIKQQAEELSKLRSKLQMEIGIVQAMPELHGQLRLGSEMGLVQAKISTTIECWKKSIEKWKRLDIFVRGKIRIGATDKTIGLLNKILGDIREQIKEEQSEMQKGLKVLEGK
jgi:hypothetical protein